MLDASAKEKLATAAQREDRLTTSEASSLTGYAADHIALLVRRGNVQGIKRGRDWLVDAKSLMSYVATEPRPGRKEKV
jgi:hypothetical protein